MRPLDFVNPPHGLSLLSFFWVGFGRPFSLGRDLEVRPVQTFPNIKGTPPRGLSAAEIIGGAFIGLGYTGIHLIGWNFHFPSSPELLLWRIASCVVFGHVVLYLIVLAVGTFCHRWIGKHVLGVRANSFLELGNSLSKWTQGCVFLPPSVSYTLARLFIIVEAFTSLRALPLGVYRTVDWSGFLPHF